VYAGNTNDLSADNFTISIYTENTFVPFIVNISPKLKKMDVLDPSSTVMGLK